MALYRKYRPATFADVVGQEHVTEPLSTALAAGRINHAYLFSGPRGCGKTSSARILARSLNCEQGPTPTPCGVCDSCVALAPNGPGSVDVVELDAASHGGVDDTRELRDRAFYAPAQSRYRIFIVDEAHMVTTAGFNALLKIVEEPPEHLIFVFATTEPEKVLPTIRSRTHHYPFRLLAPRTMRSLLERICASGGRGGRRCGVPAGDSGRRRLATRHALGARPAAGRCRRKPGGVPAGAGAARRHGRRADRRRGRRAGRGGRRGTVRRGRGGDRRRARPATVRHRPAGALPRSDRAAVGARRGRPRGGRRARGRAGADARPGHADRHRDPDPLRRGGARRAGRDARRHRAAAAARGGVRAAAAAVGQRHRIGAAAARRTHRDAAGHVHSRGRDRSGPAARVAEAIRPQEQGGSGSRTPRLHPKPSPNRRPKPEPEAGSLRPSRRRHLRRCGRRPTPWSKPRPRRGLRWAANPMRPRCAACGPPCARRSVSAAAPPR